MIGWYLVEIVIRSRDMILVCPSIDGPLTSSGVDYHIAKWTIEEFQINVSNWGVFRSTRADFMGGLISD